jgi:hypothetical protein
MPCAKGIKIPKFQKESPYKVRSEIMTKPEINKLDYVAHEPLPVIKGEAAEFGPNKTVFQKTDNAVYTTLLFQPKINVSK